MKRNSVGVARTAAAAALVFLGCSKKTTAPPTNEVLPVTRCDADLTALTNAPGSGALAHVITQPSDLFSGTAAQGRLGDYLLANDQIRLVIQQPNRIIGPDPYGGAIIDADTVHAGAGNDQFGKLAFFFNFGRTVNARNVEVINSGGQGGPAILAATGDDEVDDYINIKNVLSQYLPAGTVMQVDPDARSNFLVTTYYVLAPGQRHVTVLTAICNRSSSDALITAGDLIDSGGDVAFFSPQGQTGGFGYTSNPDAVPWMGWMASDNSIAYGVAPWKLNDPTTPETQNNCLTTAGVTGYLIGNKPGLAGLVEWTDPNARNRSGSLVVPAAGQAIVAREFAVGNDLGDVASTLETARAAKSGAAMADVSGVVSDASGPVAGARVVAEHPDPSGIATTYREAVFVTAADGSFSGHLPADSYTFTAWQLGRLPSTSVTSTLAAGTPATANLTLGAQHLLTVTIADEQGNPLPGKVTVECANGACPVTPMNLVRFEDSYQDPRPDNLQLVGFVTPSGTETFPLPPGAYNVIVSHGPEWTLFPLSSPSKPMAVDLTGTNATATVAAQLTRVVSPVGWMSADFHVHSINSPDSTTTVIDRNKTFLAEGVDVLTSSDHDYVTDYGPTNQSLGGQAQMATMVGLEISTFDYGHYNPWPLTPNLADTVTYGAIDWAGGTLDGGDLPCLSIDQIIQASRATLGATTFQINHANGSSSTFGSLGLDADTLATHQPASKFRLAPVPTGTADNTGLMPTQPWDAMEIMNGFSSSGFIGLLNNWMTFAANGLVVTGTAVSDTHKRWSSAAGYPRSYVRMANTQINAFDPQAMSASVNAHRLVGSLGLFVRAYAFVGGTAPDLTHGLVDLDAACTTAGAGCAQVGDTLAPGTSGIDFVVDVESPSWIPFNTLQLLDHTSAHPMQNGVPNSTLGSGTSGQGGYWSQSIALGTADEEAVQTGLPASFGCGSATSCSASRYHAQRVFHLAASDVPTDDFLYAVVSESDSGPSLMPLVYDGVLTSNGTTTAAAARAFAFTNAIFIDRDGGGYNHFPGVHQLHHLPRPQARHFASVAEAIRQMLADAEAEK